MRLALSYAAVVVLTGALLVAVVWVFLLRYVPDQAVVLQGERGVVGAPGPPSLFVPGRSDLWEAFAPRAAAVLGGLLLLGLAGGWLLAGRVLAPLRRITEAARRAGSGSLSHRVRLPGRDDELRRLADDFDGMLDRLEQHVAEQQRFAANASHELRTPLAITRTTLEVARQDPHRDVEDVLDRLQEINTRAVDLTEALLLLSRADHRPDAVPVDLSLAAEEAAESCLALAERRGTAVEVVGTPATVLGSPALLRQMTVNLVHNAVVHNLPSGGTVRVRTGADARTATLTVDSTGEPLDPAVLPTLLEPFRRGAGRVRPGGGAGVGLGLAIVERVVRAHDGDLALAARPGGGLVVTVRLPVAPAQPTTAAG